MKNARLKIASHFFVVFRALKVVSLELIVVLCSYPVFNMFVSKMAVAAALFVAILLL